MRKEGDFARLFTYVHWSATPIYNSAITQSSSQNEMKQGKHHYCQRVITIENHVTVILLTLNENENSLLLFYEARILVGKSLHQQAITNINHQHH